MFYWTSNIIEVWTFSISIWVQKNNLVWPFNEVWRYFCLKDDKCSRLPAMAPCLHFFLICWQLCNLLVFSFFLSLSFLEVFYWLCLLTIYSVNEIYRHLIGSGVIQITVHYKSSVTMVTFLPWLVQLASSFPLLSRNQTHYLLPTVLSLSWILRVPFIDAKVSMGWWLI